MLMDLSDLAQQVLMTESGQNLHAKSSKLGLAFIRLEDLPIILEHLPLRCLVGRNLALGFRHGVLFGIRILHPVAIVVRGCKLGLINRTVELRSWDPERLYISKLSYRVFSSRSNFEIRDQSTGAQRFAGKPPNT